MNILGINAGFSRPLQSAPGALRHPLSDGSAALLSGGRLVFAGIEERHTGQRYAGGFAQVVKAFWGSKPADGVDKIDLVAVSSCCGPRWPSDAHSEIEIQSQLPLNIWPKGERISDRLVVVDHHDSHASLGFVLSGANKALVAVIDGFGNLLEESNWSAREWWRGAFQRHSYYMAERLEAGFVLRRIGADAEGFDELGIGEAYRALAHFCGWNSYQHAGSAMALAAFGVPGRVHNVPFIELVDNRIRCRLPNDHPRPAESIAAFLREHGHEIPPMLGRTATPGDKAHCDVVRALQDQLTEALCGRLLRLAEEQKTDTIVVAGGVALNCLAMGQLQRRFAGKVFVPPAPSDTGQGLGNAIWAASCVDSPCFAGSGAVVSHAESPFWGIPSEGITPRARKRLAQDEFVILENQSEVDQYRMAARALAVGKVVAVSMGRSEYGPRALGRRSVLADPRDRMSPARVNKFKNREAHRPFAPAILEEKTMEFFAWPVVSPYMSFAVQMRADAKDKIPAVVHADGTARVQTVAQDSRSPLRRILEQFYALTGIPVLLNTSFNRKGEPMVQTQDEAVDSFINSNLDVLLIDGMTIQRKEQK